MRAVYEVHARKYSPMGSSNEKYSYYVGVYVHVCVCVCTVCVCVCTCMCVRVCTSVCGTGGDCGRLTSFLFRPLFPQRRLHARLHSCTTGRACPPSQGINHEIFTGATKSIYLEWYPVQLVFCKMKPGKYNTVQWGGGGRGTGQPDHTMAYFVWECDLFY